MALSNLVYSGECFGLDFMRPYYTHKGEHPMTEEQAQQIIDLLQEILRELAEFHREWGKA